MIETALAKPEYPTVDDYLSRTVLEKTMGDVVRNRERAQDARSYTVNSMIFNAVFETFGKIFAVEFAGVSCDDIT